MTQLTAQSIATVTSTHRSISHALRSGLEAAVIVALGATIAIEAVPRARGISFFLQLRYGIVTPACAVVTVGAALAYRIFAGRFERPRVALAAAVVVLAGLVLFGMALSGPPGLAAAGFPAAVSIAATVTWLVPQFMERTRRWRVGTVAIAVLGFLELVGVVGALRSERLAPRGSAGLAFEIPHAMFDVEHKFIDLPSGARVHYVDVGEGEPLLFLHGNPSWSFQWRDLIRGLRSSYRCVALDYPGFGLSTAPAGFGFTPREQSRIVEEFVDRMGLRDITLVMQDWGGPIGIGFAERRPELVRRVVLGSTWAWRTSTHEPRGQWSVVAGGPVGEFVQVNFDGITSFSLKSGIVRKVPPNVLDLYLCPFRPLNRRGIAAFYPGQITLATTYFAAVEANLPRVADKRALIFWALKDPGFPRSDLARWEEIFPNHKTVELPNANHFFFEDTAEQVIQEIRAFVSSDPIGHALASKDLR